MMQSEYRASVQPLLLLTAGFWIGRVSTNNNGETSNFETFVAFVEQFIIPLYTAAVVAHLTARILQKYVLNETHPPIRPVRKPVKKVPTDVSSDDSSQEEPPVNMTGRYKLVSVENFEAFLEVQGVPWALRIAACRARPIHKLTHRGNQITINIEGIISTQTTYIIGGPAVEVNIRGRLFQDRLTYLEDGRGIRSIKEAVSENYNVVIDRVLSEDKLKIILTSRAVFNDGREPVESVQVFERME